MRRQHGITLIDSLVVATVFAMFAFAAVPRYAFLSQEARVDAVTELAKNVRETADLTHRVWASAGRPQQLSTNDRVLELGHGYPTIASVGTVIIDSGGFRFDSGRWTYQSGGSDVDGCGVHYWPPEDQGDRPVVTVSIDGC